MPAWLRAALVEMSAHKNLIGGPAQLAKLAGKSLHQVNTVCRRHLDATTTEVVNRLRLEYAARTLRLTSDTIEEIGNAPRALITAATLPVCLARRMA